MKHKLKKTDDNTIEITIIIPWKTVKSAYDVEFEKASKNVEVKGFRKGKAPKKLVKEHIKPSVLYEEVIKKLIPDAYSNALKTEKIKPIMHPSIELKKAKEGEDWVVVAKTCERPDIKLGDYKKAITQVKNKTGKKIWTPGDKEAKKEDTNKANVDEILTALYQAVKVTLPNVLIEHEVNRLLSDLVDRTKQLGLSVDQYLASTGKTQETVKKDYEEQAKRTLTLEFALETIGDKENISITDKELDDLIEKTAKTDEEKENMQRQRYYLASVLRRQKIIDQLTQ